MDPKWTAVLAVWGAVVSTIALGWQFFLWFRANPRVHARATMMESPAGGAAEDWIEFKLRNRGGKPTTVEEIKFVSYGNWLDQLFRVPSCTENIWVRHPADHTSPTMKLPAVLQPGELWKGGCYLGPRSEQPRLDGTRRERFNAGKLCFRIRCAHTDRIISGVVKPESLFERL